MHSPVTQVAHDRVLDARVDGDDARAVAPEEHRLRRGDRAREISSGHRGLAHHSLAGLCLRHLRVEYSAAHRALVAYMPYERPRVDTRERRDAAVGQPGETTTLRVRGVLTVDSLAHDHRSRVDAVGLHLRLSHPVIADQRIGEDDDLTGVAGIGHRLLIARHGRVEDHLAGAGGCGADGLTVEAGAVLEQEVSRAAAHATAPSAKLRSR